jgi:hypothetical protein
MIAELPSGTIGDLRTPPPPPIIRNPRYAVSFQINSPPPPPGTGELKGQNNTALSLTGENRAGDRDGTPQSMAQPRASSPLSTILDTRPISVSKRVSVVRRILRVVGWWVDGWVGVGEPDVCSNL